MSYYFIIVDEPESNFYKDEGGKSHCLKCKLEIRSESNPKVAQRFAHIINLDISLEYEDGQIVDSPDVKPIII